MKIFALALLMMLALAFLVLPIVAQEGEVTEEAPLAEEAPVVIVVDPVVQNQAEAVFTNLVKLLWNAAFLPFAAPMALVMTSLSKRVLTKVSSPAQVFFWTVVLWLLYLGATQFGYANQFESLVGTLATLGATVFGITLTPAAAGALHSYAKKNNVAILGYSRPVLEAVNSPQGEKALIVEGAS